MSTSVGRMAGVFCLLVSLIEVGTTHAQSVSGQQWLAWDPAGSSIAADRQPGFQIAVRFDQLTWAAAVGGTLDLPLDGELRVRIAVAWAQADRNQTFIAGPLMDGRTGEASVTTVGRTLVSRIRVDDRLFVVRQSADSGVHVVTEVDPQSFPPELQPRLPPLPTTGPLPRAQAETAADSNAFVDLMVLFTPASRAAIGGTAAMVAELTGAVNNANLALANASVTHRFRLVHQQEVAYTETGDIATSLDRLTFGDGYMDDVFALRDLYRADVVTLLTTDSNACGLGWLMGPSNVNAAFAPYAYSVVSWTCANANLSMAHEIGHNMGLQHDRPNAASLPAFSYAYGYAVPGLARDVMAYPCAVSCPRRAIYSTPLSSFPGSSVAAGTTTEDGRRALDGTSLVVANFRQTVCTYALASSSTTVGPLGATGSVGITAPPECTWTAATNSPSFLTVTTTVNGSGNGVVSYAVSANRGAIRNGTITIAGQVFTVKQLAPERAGDFDGDGKADISVFRPSTGAWYIRGSSVSATHLWGGGADVPVAADYDGDGRIDIAVYRPSTGVWYIIPTTTMVGMIVNWGGGADIPVAADYDGDSKADVAVYRPSSGAWYIIKSTTMVGSVVFWGGGADIPVPRDYDGDGNADVSVYRPSTGTWYIINSSTMVGSTVTWGGGADVPVPRDYDGDGKADIGVYRPSTGVWYIINSSTSVGAMIPWGGGADIPVPADYDGDGKADVCVFRPSTGAWYLINSSTNVGSVLSWGGVGDVAILMFP